jgi:hypothetical protein
MMMSMMQQDGYYFFCKFFVEVPRSYVILCFLASWISLSIPSPDFYYYLMSPSFMVLVFIFIKRYVNALTSMSTYTSDFLYELITGFLIEHVQSYIYHHWDKSLMANRLTGRLFKQRSPNLS